MKLTYYPGCSLHSTAEEYSLATLAVLRALGVEVEELEDWNCCGASSGHSTSHFLAKALPLRNLILAEGQGPDLMAPCAACYNLLKSVDLFMRQGSEEAQALNQEMRAVMGAGYQGGVQVKHLLQVVTDPEVLTGLERARRRPLRSLRLAAYYGCLLTRPRAVAFEENPEQPQSMERVLRLLGADPVPWTHRTRCCGASLAISQTELVVTMVDQIVAAARRAGAQALVTVCPLCHSNLDTRQKEPGMPVFFLPELIGLALDVADLPAWLKKHIVDPLPLLRSLNLLAA